MRSENKSKSGMGPSGGQDSGSVHSLAITSSNNNLTKAYHGQVMQALYSQPHKMMVIKPGV